MAATTDVYGQLRYPSGVELPSTYSYAGGELKKLFPLGKWLEQNMAFLDEVAKTHKWTEDYADDYRITETGFKWYRYTPTKELFVPSLTSEGAGLSGTTYLYYDFWQYLRDVSAFANEKRLIHSIDDGGPTLIADSSGIYMDDRVFDRLTSSAFPHCGNIADYSLNVEAFSRTYAETGDPTTIPSGFVPHERLFTKVPQALYEENILQGERVTQDDYGPYKELGRTNRKLFFPFDFMSPEFFYNNTMQLVKSGYYEQISPSTPFVVASPTHVQDAPTVFGLGNFATLNGVSSSAFEDYQDNPWVLSEEVAELSARNSCVLDAYTNSNASSSTSFTQEGAIRVTYTSLIDVNYFPTSTMGTVSNSGENLSLRTTHGFVNEDNLTSYYSIGSGTFPVHGLKDRFKVFYGYINFPENTAVYDAANPVRVNEGIPFVIPRTNTIVGYKVAAIEDAIIASINGGNYTILDSLPAGQTLKEHDILSLIDEREGEIMFFGVFTDIDSAYDFSSNGYRNLGTYQFPSYLLSVSACSGVDYFTTPFVNGGNNWRNFMKADVGSLLYNSSQICQFQGWTTENGEHELIEGDYVSLSNNTVIELSEEYRVV